MPKRARGEGSVTKRKDGRWMARANVGYDIESEKTIRKSFYGKTRQEATQKMNDALADVRKGTYIEPTKMIFAQWIKTWINITMKLHLRPTTWDSYQSMITNHITPTIGHIPLNRLRTAHLQNLYNDKLKSGRVDGMGGLSARTVRYIHAIIHGALEQAIKENLLITNPAKAVKLPKNEKKIPKHFDTASIKLFLELAKKSRHYTAYLVELNTGVRRGELLSLRWSDINMSNAKIYICRNLVRSSEQGLIFQEPKTKLSKRSIDVHISLIKDLKDHKKKQAEEKLSAGQAYEDNDLVFCTPFGKPLDPRAFSAHFKKIIKGTKLEDMTLHGLRHTLATISIQEGIDFNTVQEILGHHSPAFTLATYAHVTEQMKNKQTEAIGKLIDSCKS